MIIGLSGYAQSGKSTIAAELIARGYTHRKFAAPLKLMLQSLLEAQGVPFGVRYQMIEGNLKEVPSDHLNGATPRHAMQTLGTDWGRALICENLWCDAAMRGVKDVVDVVFDDVRFQNEADAIRLAGGIIVRLNRPGVGPVNNHVSEELPWADMEISNDSTPAKAVNLILRQNQTVHLPT